MANMTRRSFILIAISAMACAGAVAQEEDIFSPKLRITWDDFKKLYDANKAVVIDVRDEGSFSNGHISGARSIPLDTLEKRIAELRKLKKPIVTYCA
jgi:3-mercaptopyruvate sulfurtransferase SseA